MSIYVQELLKRTCGQNQGGGWKHGWLVGLAGMGGVVGENADNCT